MTDPFIIHPSSVVLSPCALQSKLPGELKGKLPAAKQLANIARAEMEGGK